MVFSASGSGWSGECKNFKQITRERLLHEMLRSCKTGDSKSTMKVLIMDEFTKRIMNYTCKVYDLTQEGVPLLELIVKKRQPMRDMDAIYFIQPSKENVRLFMSDMSGREPLYRKAFIFFTSPISKDLVSRIKEGSVLSRISALKEMNLEYFAIDTQAFVTDNERALAQLYGDDEDSRNGVACLNEMSARVATVFASLREFPLVRYRAAKSLDSTTMTTFRDLIPTKLAAGIWDYLMKYKTIIPNFPETETCELLVLDRSVDQIAPIIHEWTYDGICHDLLNMEGNKYVLEVPSKTGGPPDKKVVVLESQHDPVWLELHHEHIGVVFERLREKSANFHSKYKFVEFYNPRDTPEPSTRELKKITEALPEYVEQRDQLSLHTEIAVKINTIIKELRLSELSQLEERLVFGYAGMRDVIKYLATNEDQTGENKLRLLMILAAIYPEKFEGEGQHDLMKLAKLTPNDMSAVSNMKLIGESESRKKSSGIFSLKFNTTEKNRAARKERPSEGTYQFTRFYPMIEELIEKLSKGELSKEEYPCLNDPSPTLNQAPNSHSMRSRRTPMWAQRRNSSDGLARYASSDFKQMGKRIFVVIAGGATRSELRVCHQLTAKLKREVILGSSSLDDPATFITKVKMMTTQDQLLTLDALQI